MKCMMCENYSLTHICSSCQTNFLSPSLYTRQLENGINVYSFYKYKEIKKLLFTKHTDLGFYIYTILAQNSFSIFAQSFSWHTKIASLPIDDHIKNTYSHTAILNKALYSHTITPLFAKLRAQNSVNYSGKNRLWRMMHPRNFQLKEISYTQFILVDDIITTGSTLSQACKRLEDAGKEVLFCLTLTDVHKE